MPERRTRPGDQCRLSTPGAERAGYSHDTAGIAAFQAMVLRHYENAGRKMMWRDTTDPYCILVSEIMLQQTQVGRVEVKYPEFIAKFPDFETLARAPLADLLSVWQGMGYNRRAIALRKCAVRVVREFDGILPADPAVLATFPGIGPATGASICAFAFTMPVVFIETNIRRVFLHFFFADREGINDREILPLVEKSLFRENPRVWYWALMDLGTELKKTVVNPNRRSAHYTKQAAFEGSDRKIRGEILRLLLTVPSSTEKEILAAFPEPPVRIRKILGALEKEGFVTVKGSSFSLVR